MFPDILRTSDGRILTKQVMKKTSIILTLAVLFTGCIERSHLDDNQYDPSVYLTHWGLVKTDTFYDVSRSYSAPLYVYCAGYKAADATVRLEYDETLIDLYNADNGTAYRPLPSDCYTIGNDEVSTVKDVYRDSRLQIFQSL